MYKEKYYFFILMCMVLFFSGCGVVKKQLDSSSGGDSTPTRYTVSSTVSPNNVGLVSISPNGTVFTSGTQVIITAQALSSNYVFDTWIGSITNNSSTTQFIITSNISVTACFKIKQPIYYPVNVSVSPSATAGTITFSPLQSSYLEGSTLNLIAAPNPPYYFSYWEGDLNETSSSVQLSVNTTKNITAVFTGPSWRINTPSFYIGSGSYPSLCIDNDNNYYLANGEISGGRGFACVYKYNQNAWSIIRSASEYNEARNSLYANEAGNIYHGFQISSVYNYETHGKVYLNGGWRSLGSNTFSIPASYGAGGYPSIIEFNNTAYVAYAEGGNNNKAIVKKEGPNAIVPTSLDWLTVGGFVSSGEARFTKLGKHNNNLYLAFCDIANNAKMSVFSLTGSTWTSLGATGFTPGNILSCDFAVDNAGTPYVAFISADQQNKISVMKYTGTTWTYVSSSFTPTAKEVVMSIDGDTLYIGYIDADHQDTISIQTYANNSWNYVGQENFSSANCEQLALAVKNSHVLTAFRNKTTGQVSVMEYK